MKQLLLAVLIVLTSLRPVGAKLGDRYETIDDAYGSLVERHLLDDGTVSVVYKKGRYFYFVLFDGGRSVLEKYSHVKGTDLSEKEIAKFLKAYAGGETWITTDKPKDRFKRSDGKVEAMYATVDGRPTLTVREVRSQRD
jgi:hypothetical protein